MQARDGPEAVHSSTDSIRLFDNQGVIRAELTLRDGQPVLALFDSARCKRVSIHLTLEGFPQLQLWSAGARDPVLRLASDACGSHVVFGRPDTPQGHFFAGESGVIGMVMIRASGGQWADWMVRPDGVTVLNAEDP